MAQRKRTTAFETPTVGSPVLLDHLPINEPEKEKSLLEQNGYLEWVTYLSKGRRLFFVQGDRSRISEVYRLCYERRRSLSIITDFVAYFPSVVFQSPWLAALVNQESRMAPGAKGDALMLALSNGFKRAARGTRFTRWIHKGRLEAAKLSRRIVQEKLAAFHATLGRDATPEFIEQNISAYVARLVQEDPRLNSLRGVLRGMLKRRELYKASVIITQAQFRARRRNLESA